MAYYYINDDSAELGDVLSRDIPWETYMTARLLTDKDLNLIRRYDKRSDELRASMLDEAGPAYTAAFMSVLRSVTKEETVQYALATLLQMLQENPARARFFHQQSDQHLSAPPEPYSVFLRLLQRQDWFTQEKACKLLTVVIESRPKRPVPIANGSDASSGSVFGGQDPAEQYIHSFMEWLCNQLRRQSGHTKSLSTAISSLAALLKERSCRQLFDRADGVGLLPRLIKESQAPTSSQLLYELCLVAWQMSFLKEAAAKMNAETGLINALVDVCRTAQKEKVFRAALAALRNLLSYDDLGLAVDMVEAGLQKVVITRQLQSWSDEDITEMLSYMDGKLGENIQTLSNFDRYKKEVLSGSLQWSPMHTSENFWRENVNMFEEKDYLILRVLLKLIETSKDVKTLSVGCHDIGQFVMYHSQGRYVVSQFRGKELVMRHLSHPDPEVQKQALLCVQKLMLTKDKLEFLQNSAPAQ